MITCCRGCEKENDCRWPCTRYFQYLDSIDEEQKPILTAKEKKMDKFNGYFNEFENRR